MLTALDYSLNEKQEGGDLDLNLTYELNISVLQVKETTENVDEDHSS